MSGPPISRAGSGATFGVMLGALALARVLALSPTSHVRRLFNQSFFSASYADYLRALPTPTWQQVATTNKPATRVAAFKDDVSGAPGRIRTYAHGSGGRCSIP